MNKSNPYKVKRIFDFTVSCLGLIFFAPLLVFIYLLNKLIHPKDPAIFKQNRIGYKGELFTIYKFRTMNTYHKGSSVSIAGEDRITRFGAFLRKFKLDELPELYNVLINDMSFVGPRPDVPGFADKLVGEDKKILDLKPGITGPASLLFANEEELLSKVDNPVKYNLEVIYPKKIKINLDYYYNNSLYIDLVIIFRTIFRTNY
tara:strand:- start:21 stop:629 length:609 start_codon:yes stop_codon:yes gene_type:complete